MISATTVFFPSDCLTEPEMQNKNSKAQSIQALRKKHKQAVAGKDNSKEITQMFYTDPWFHDQLKKKVRRAIGKSPEPNSNLDDVAQEAWIHLFQSIERDPTLGFSFNGGSYAAFLEKVIFSACMNGCRLKRSKLIPRSKLYIARVDDTDWKKIDWKIDLHELCKHISKPSRKFLELYTQKGSLQEVANNENKSLRTVSRWFDRAVAELKKVIEYSDDKQAPSLVLSQKSKYEIAKGSKTKPNPK